MQSEKLELSASSMMVLIDACIVVDSFMTQTKVTSTIVDFRAPFSK